MQNTDSPTIGNYAIPDEFFERCVHREDLVQRILRTFVKQMNHDIPALAENIRDGDAVAATTMACRIKGAAAHVAAEELRHPAGIIEQLAANDQLADAAEQVVSLQGTWSRFENSVETFLQTNSTAPSASVTA